MKEKNFSLKTSEEISSLEVDAKVGEVSIKFETDSQLLLKEKNLRNRTISLFKELRKDKLLKEAFIKNPTEVISTKILEKNLDPHQISETNRLLFSLLANENFLKWIDKYSLDNHKRHIDKKQFRQDFANAVIKFDDKNIIASMINHASFGWGIPGVDIMQQLVINNASGDAVATDVNSPSTSDESLRSSQNFNGIGFGDLRHLNPTFVRTLIEELITYARSLNKLGDLANINSIIR